MAAGSVTVAALRHRPRQALLIVVLSAVVTAAAALGPLYARAVEQSVLRTVVAGAPSEQSTLVITADGNEGKKPVSPRGLARTVGGAVPPQFGAPIGGANVAIAVPISRDEAPVRARLVSRDRLCRHLAVSAGRCARAPGEAMLSRRSGNDLGLTLGDTITVVDGAPGQGGVRRRLTVVGLHDAIDPSAPYWAGRGTPPVPAQSTSRAPQRTTDDVYTTWQTLAADPWPDLQTHLDIPLGTEGLDLDHLGALQGITEQIDEQAATVGGSATSQIGDLLTSTETQRDQARTVIPLLAVQLAVLGIVVLAFVCAAATEQRRPEIALARLRGHGTTGATTMLLRELGVLVLAGAILGTIAGWLAALLATKAWLAPGVTLEARRPVLLAVLGAVVAGVLAILAAATPTLRQPLTALLRRVPPRSSTLQVGLVEGAVVAAAAAGLVTALSGDSGPVALLAPGLLAIAGGLLLAQATIPTAGPLARAALRAGRLPWAMAGMQIARRPALRRLIAIITVACALLVFAVDAWMVAGRNRDTRAAVEAGAAVVLTVDAETPQQLRTALLDIDPHGRFATPVVTTHSATPVGPVTTAVEPASFRRIAQWGGKANRLTDKQTHDLRPPTVDPIPLPDAERTEIAITADYVLDVPLRPPGFRGTQPQAISLAVALTPPDAKPVFVDLGQLRVGPHIYRGQVSCPGCELSEIVINRAFGDSYPVDQTLTVRRIEAGPTDGALSPLDLGPFTDEAWQVVPLQSFFASAEVNPGPPLIISDNESFATIEVRRGDLPPVLPSLSTGKLSRPFSAGPGSGNYVVLAPDLAGSERQYEETGRLRLVPRSGSRGVLVDLATAARASGGGVQTTYAVWLADDDRTREAALRRGLADHGLQVLARDTTGEHARAFAAEGPSLALRLALLAGVLSVVLAAAVLVVGVATSGASRARDLAGLRIVGVPAGTVRRASVREHLVVAALGVIAGAALGLVAAQAALPQVPLFARTSARLPLDLAPAWVSVVVTAVACLVLLCAVSVVVGRALAASAVPSRLREAP